MPKPTDTRTPRRIAILLFEGFSNLCLANAVEPLRAANSLARRPLYEWSFLSLDGGPVTSSSGLPVQPARLGSVASGSWLLVMPSYGHKALATPALKSALRQAAGHFDMLIGLDTGSWLLAAADLLQGYRATAHWDILTELGETFPEVSVCDAPYVIDRDRASCGVATTTLDLMLALIKGQHGSALALEVAALFMYGTRDQGQPVPGGRRVQQIAATMRRHVETPLPIPALAAQLGMGQRKLERLVRRETGNSPAALYRTIRLWEARRRVEDTRESLAEIAGRCGYDDAAAFSRAFKAAFGTAPSRLRDRDRAGSPLP
jgi:transcriptional regulator GlxA family with amidase domain